MRAEIPIPVLLVDFKDYDPAKDATFGKLFNNYSPTSPEDYEAFLNGAKAGPNPRQIFLESSGSLFRPQFKVYGWIHGARQGSHLKGIGSYHSKASSGAWICNSAPLVRDAIADAIAFHGLNLDEYDTDKNGILDGIAVVVEGYEPCAHQYVLATRYADGSIKPVETSRLVPESDPDYGKFRDQKVSPNRYVYICEKKVTNEFALQWTHELGHMFLGIDDYYSSGANDKVNLFPWTLTSGQITTHLSAWEKAIFGGWIEPILVAQSSTVTIEANETADGSNYQEPRRLLYKILIDGDEYHYLTLENRWWQRHGNSGTTGYLAEGGYADSGLVIFESNWRVVRSSTTEAQVIRHHPERTQYPLNDARYATYQPGERFEKCWRTECVTIEPLDAAGAEIRIKIDIRPR